MPSLLMKEKSIVSVATDDDSSLGSFMHSLNHLLNWKQWRQELL
jgi:hypothetical protein